MAELRRWSGNDTTDNSIYDDELTDLKKFIDSHKINYIFGKGKIGTALAHYFKQADFPFKKAITSADIGEIKRVYEPGKTGIIIGVGDRLLSEIISVLENFMREDDIFILSEEKRESIGNVFSLEKTKEEFWINIFVTNQCNLYCKSCSTFAPICRTPEKYELEEFIRDIKQLRDLRLPTLRFFNFTGGEPFKHPQLLELFAEARRCFPEQHMNCYTNGLLLAASSDEYLKRFKDLDITLTITEYPLPGLSLQNSYRRLDAIGVGYSVIYCDGQKFFSKRPLNEDKNVDKYQFYYCPRYKTCNSLFLYKGKLTKCVYAFGYRWLNEAFHTNFVQQDKDFIDIYHTCPEEIYQYCIERIPFCGYCKPIEEYIPWGLSEKRIEEWT